MPTGKDLIFDANKRVLIYGRSGSGKTSLIGKALEVPEMCPIYAFDFDMRLNSILAVAPRQLIVENLSYDQYRDTAGQSGKAFTDAEAKLRELERTVGRSGGVRTVALDSLTFMEKSIASRVLLMDGKPASAPLALNHYKAIISQVEDFIGKICALNCNVIVTAHEDIDKDEITQAMVRGIGVTGKKLPSILPGYFNELWYAEVCSVPNAKPLHKIRTAPTNLLSARTVYSNYLEPVEDQDIWKKIFKIDRDEQALQQLAGNAA